MTTSRDVGSDLRPPEMSPLEEFQSICPDATLQDVQEMLEQNDFDMQLAISSYLSLREAAAATAPARHQQQQQQQQQRQKQQPQRRDEDDDARAPIPTFVEQLMPGGESEIGATRDVFLGGGGRKRRGVSAYTAFRDFRDESRGVSELERETRTEGVCSLRKTHELTAQFRPPLELLFRGSLEEAKQEAQRSGKKWILVNVQDVGEFASHVLNRDVWRDARVRELVAKDFVMWQVDVMGDSGQRFARLYRTDKLPFVGVLDGVTGELALSCVLKSCPLADDMFDDLKRIVSGEPGALNRNATSAVIDMSEEELVRIAMAESLKPQPKSSASLESLLSASWDSDVDDSCTAPDESDTEDCGDEADKEKGKPEQERHPQPQPEPVPESEPEPAPPAAKKSKQEEQAVNAPEMEDQGPECVVQIRQTNGSTLVHTFHAGTTLRTVVRFIELNRTDCSDPFVLCVPYPRKVLTDLQATLQDLGLVPRSALVMQKRS